MKKNKQAIPPVGPRMVRAASTKESVFNNTS
jgi:hypothetical protein